MLSIGIDVSKGKSTVCGMKPGGEIVYTPFEVQHTRKGMSELVSLLHNSGEEVRAVLESTGSYHTAGGYISGASASGAAVLPDDLPSDQGEGRF